MADTIALNSGDRKREYTIAFALTYKSILSRYQLIA